MSDYEYLADRLDQLEYPDVADLITNTEPEEWFSESTFLSFIQAAITTIASNNRQHNPFTALQKQKTPITPIQSHTAITEWLYRVQCPYLDLIFPSQDSTVKPAPDSDYLSKADNAGLILEYITSEYEFITFTKAQNEQQKPKTPTTTNANNNINGGNDQTQAITAAAAAANNAQGLDLDVLLKATPYKPSLVESISTSLHHLHAHFLDIEMYLTDLDLQQIPGSVLSPQQQEYYSKQALLSISPSTTTTTPPHPQSHPGLIKLATIDARLTTVLKFIKEQRESYDKSHVLHPFMDKLDQRLLTNHPASRLLGFLRKTQLSQLTAGEVTVVKDLLAHLNEDYQTRHNRLLQKMLTQTQTFLFALKWKYLQHQQQQQGGQAAKPAAAAQPKAKAKAKAPKQKKTAAGGKPIEDGANDDYDSDDDDVVDWSGSNSIGAASNVKVDSAEYFTLLTHIIKQYKETFQLISYLTPLHIGDLWMVSNFTALVLGGGNEKQLHRPRAKFQLGNHPRMKQLGVMADRGGRLNQQ